MSRTCSRIHLAVNAAGILMCSSAAIVFGILGNYYAVIWCCVALILAVLNTYIRGVHYIDKLEDWYSLSCVQSIRDFGMCIAIFICGFFGYYLFQIFYYHESFQTPISQSTIIVAVWCFISAKYAFTLFWVGRQYLNELSETRLLLQ